MAVLPETTIEQIQFCETHYPVWEVAPTTIGLTAGQVAALKTKTISARDSYNNAQAARDASKAATTTLNTQAGLMREDVRELISLIKSYADSQAVPGTVYAAAQIPEPLPPSPLPAPGVATNFVVTLLASGAVSLSWDASNAAASSGAFYNVYRKLPGATGFTPIGGAPGTTSASRRMSFTDFAIPTSAAGAGVQYVIQGQRGTLMGTSSEAITVQFGTDGGSFTFAGATTNMKIAA